MEAKIYPSTSEMQSFRLSEGYCFTKLIEDGELTLVEPKESLLEQGFEKVDEDGGSYEHCVCLNPKTREAFRVLEWDYEDVRVDDNAYRQTCIDYNSEAFKLWWDLVYRDRYDADQIRKKELAEQLAKQPKVGEKAVVVKGRTLPKGTMGVVTKIWEIRVSYHNIVTYALLDNQRIALKNLEKVAC